jgi:hypothetical protein
VTTALAPEMPASGLPFAQVAEKIARGSVTREVLRIAGEALDAALTQEGFRPGRWVVGTAPDEHDELRIQQWDMLFFDTAADVRFQACLRMQFGHFGNSYSMRVWGDLCRGDEPRSAPDSVSLGMCSQSWNEIPLGELEDAFRDQLSTWMSSGGQEALVACANGMARDLSTIIAP